ncbi:hypothetical protein ALC57_13364 [Trachymyrmex cornetzi]|uniref:Uncharacterized protein n=1 Tax=Trachymyrmex cornetzi TaxID=471704 RepID=A0A151IZB1_9HYME|nr:hypothetical protein ALC57_13364 [Trachymyrmex cornetzi]
MDTRRVCWENSFEQRRARAGSSDEEGSEGGKWEEGGDRTRGPVSSPRDPRRHGARFDPGFLGSVESITRRVHLFGRFNDPKKGSEYGIPENFADSIRDIRRSANLSCPDSFGGVSLAIDNNKAML